MLQNISELVDLAAVNQRRRSKHLRHGFVQRLGAIQNDQEAAIGPQATALEIRQEALTHGRILGRPVPTAERVFSPGVIDAERDDEAVLADVDPVDQQREEIEGVEGRGSPGVERRRGLHYESAAHGTLARPARGHRRRQWLETARVLPRRHADEHLFDDATIQRILAGHQLKRRQRHFRAVRADPRPANRDLPTTEHHLARHRATPRGLTVRLMLITRTADRGFDPLRASR